MFRTTLLAALVAGATVLAAPAYAQSSPVLGAWTTKVDVGGTIVESTWTFAQSGSAYTIDIKDGPFPGAPADAPPMQSVISDLVVDGGTFSFKRVLTTPQGPFNLSYTGSVDGNTLTGTVNSDFGPIPITGTRN